MNAGEVFHGSTMTISVGSRAGLNGKSLVASVLADYLHSLTRQDILLVKVVPDERGAEGALARLLSSEPGDAYEDLSTLLPETGSGVYTLKIPARSGQTASWYAERASNLISRLSDRFTLMIFDLISEPSALFEAVPFFSDVCIEIVDSPSAVPRRPPARLGRV